MGRTRYSLHDYLEISLASAKEQWTSILQRSSAGGRQVDFVPAETLVCLAASLVINYKRYSGSTRRNSTLAEPIPTLARLFQRPSGSILAKMANLDGGLRNGARNEIEVAARLLSSPAQLAAVYRIIVGAAREVGIGSEALPDFLHLEGDNGEIVLLGQEELDLTELENEVQPAVKKWAREHSDLEEQVTERLLTASVRVGQHRFARDVLQNHGHRCVFCGLAVTASGLRATRMLVASHIKPWRVSTPSERLDPRNGLAACPTHDVAFDTGLMTVNGGLRIHVKPHLAKRVFVIGVSQAG